MPAIYTRSGDAGQTGLFGGSRVPKQSDIVEAYGSVDEMNTAIGAAKVACTVEPYRSTLDQIQRRLHILAAELASDEAGRAKLEHTIDQADIDALERLIDDCVALTGPMRQFTVPGHDEASVRLHQARTVARRAERRILTAAESSPIRPEIVKYVNRLSDALFAIARVGEVTVERDQLEATVRQIVAQTLSQSPVAPPPSAGGSYQVPGFDLAACKRAAEAAEAQAQQMGLPVVFAAVDGGGNLVLLHRMADSLLASVELAINKAFTAVSLKLPTGELSQAAGPDGPLAGLGHSHQGRIVLFGGGLPLFVDGRAVGGIGVSGGTVEEDLAVVASALQAIQEER
ncbi:MAG: cob(I)yrinic acid a,c-diamide adenosyltransferase [Propionibacteriaceae bacterium]|jgi:ATP:cob(I)alamin adenosyltransferase|nr:cob(I)yrinic acid a,c-diamide adenosyltransferase [Propionibacteriaceae bacterium]